MTTSMPSPSPRTKPAEVRLDELMNAAETLFLENGFDATTIAHITRAANVAKGTFYHYFASKNDILAALTARYTQQYVDQLETAVNACAEHDWPTRLRVWIETSVLTYAQSFRTHDMVYGGHHHHERDNAEKNAILTQLEHILQQGAQDKAWYCPNPAIVALLLYSGVHGATDALIAEPEQDHQRYARELADTCLRLLPLP
ncbi:TetR/AcrR family transcriptional regulator [Paenalcaligenes sp. Me131]|uniref:TetR/AcrR family transcriptional regulator n=1 Tax=Paenalcaligenes sp. Me131 TaxID=3392636 RepID=UPI003D29E31D